jgi:hypothetical protein
LGCRLCWYELMSFWMLFKASLMAFSKLRENLCLPPPP